MGTTVTQKVLLVAVGDDGEFYPLKVDPVTGVLHTDAVINVGSLTVDSDVSDRPGRLVGHVTVDSLPAVVLDATSLAALETINIGNIPHVVVDSTPLVDVSALATSAKQDTLLTELQQKLEPGDLTSLAQRTDVQTLSSRFARLLKFEPSAGEELRAEDLSTDRYHGAAVDGTATSANSWDVVRFYKDASGNITRVRFKSGIKWDDRAVAGNWP